MLWQYLKILPTAAPCLTDSTRNQIVDFSSQKTILTIALKPSCRLRNKKSKIQLSRKYFICFELQVIVLRNSFENTYVQCQSFSLVQNLQTLPQITKQIIILLHWKNLHFTNTLNSSAKIINFVNKALKPFYFFIIELYASYTMALAGVELETLVSEPGALTTRPPP